MPKLGTISLGIKDESRNGAPRSTGYFVIKTEDPIWKKVIADCYGETPTRLFISVPSQNLDDTVHNVLQLRNRDKIKAETDNVNLWKLTDGKYEMSDPADIRKVGGIEKAKQMMVEHHEGYEWKEALMFQFLIVPTKWDEENNIFEMPYRDTVMTIGAFRLYTHGKETMDNILSTLEMMRMSSFFALDYTMKSSEGKNYPVIRLTPVIMGSFGASMITSGDAAQNLPEGG